MSVFGVFFVGFSPAIPDSAFKQADATHWVLDITSTVTPQHQALKEVSLFLARPNVLPPGAALGLYVSIGGSEWSFRGFVSDSHPSEVMPLNWPERPNDLVLTPGFAQIGVSVEPLAEVSVKEGAKLGAKEDFCKRVGMDLFQYMQSFGDVRSVGPEQLLVPTNVLDKWFTRISTRLRHDPDFLTRQKDAI